MTDSGLTDAEVEQERQNAQALEDELSLAEHLAEALKATEWHREDGHGPPQCSVCKGWRDLTEGDMAGHRPDCIVGAALAQFEETRL